MVCNRKGIQIFMQFPLRTHVRNHLALIELAKRISLYHVTSDMIELMEWAHSPEFVLPAFLP